MPGMPRFIALISTLIVFVPLFAAEGPEPVSECSKAGLSAVEIATENDIFAMLVTHGGDKYYSNGFKLAYVTPALNDATDSGLWRAHFGLVHELYTAGDTGSPNPPVSDHPYSAWLYGVVGAGYETDSTLDLFSLRAGVVGPSALGKQLQNGYHRLASEATTEGWNTQLHDEPGIDVEWRRVWRIRLTEPTSGIDCDLLPRIGYEVGTVRHVGTGGLQFRFGKNLPRDFGVRTLRESAVNGAPVKFKSSGSGWAPDSYYGFFDFSVEGRVRDMALDGSLYHDGRSVDSNPFVAQGGFGFALHWGGVRVTLSEYVRSEEFKGQGSPFWFGALTLTTSF